MKLFGFAPTFALFLAAMLVHMTNGQPASCTNYTKEKFGPTTITEEVICEDACQTAEGLPVGRFKSEGDFYSKCTCLLITNSGEATETRDLCQTGEPSGVSQIFAGMRLVLATSLLVALAFV